MICQGKAATGPFTEEEWYQHKDGCIEINECRADGWERVSSGDYDKKKLKQSGISASVATEYRRFPYHIIAKDADRV